jgi:hypothetical protein
VAARQLLVSHELESVVFASLGRPTLLLGFNYAWSRNSYSGDFGPDFNVTAAEWYANNQLEAKGDLSAIPPHKLFEFLDQNLNDLRRLGFSVVRWFILGNGNAYGAPPTAVQAGGKRTYNFTPPAVLDQRFRRDFTALLAAFKKANMQLIPSLIDFKFGSTVYAGPNVNGTFYGGRADVITDKTKRGAFLDTVLKELLSASQDFPAQIYAWEVINEPFWLCHPFGALAGNPPITHPPEVSVADMKSFLTDALQRIEAANFASTVGHRYFTDLSIFPAGTAPQFHYYAKHPLYPGYSDPEQIKGQHLFSTNPIPFLGELDSDLNVNGNPWPELGSGDTTLARLRILESEKCPLAMIWPDLPDNIPLVATKDIIKLADKTRTQVAAFTHGVLPPPDRNAP